MLLFCGNIWLSEIQSMQTVEQNYQQVEGIKASDWLAFVF